MSVTRSDHARAVLATVLYYDIFDYPLTPAEVLRFGHATADRLPLTLADTQIENAGWVTHAGVLFLPGRAGLPARRKALALSSARKFQRAQRVAGYLQSLPFVRFIGVTGSLAMQCAAPEDDIDFLIVTAADRVWLTRALVLSLLWVLGVKRADNEAQHHPNKICANIFVAEDGLTFPDQSLFIAHEFCQMVPLWGQACYTRFVAANAWVREFLPHWSPTATPTGDHSVWRAVQRLGEWLLAPWAAGLERWAERQQRHRIQRKHAHGHNPNVRLAPRQLRFHPRDLAPWVAQTYAERWRQLSETHG